MDRCHATIEQIGGVDVLTTLDLASSSVVLRRAIADDMPAIVRLMTCLAEANFPVPGVYDFSGPDLVMERLDGRDMLADLSSQPWLVGRHARTLAELNDQLHAIVAPAAAGAVRAPSSAMIRRRRWPGWHGPGSPTATSSRPRQPASQQERAALSGRRPVPLVEAQPAIPAAIQGSARAARGQQGAVSTKAVCRVASWDSVRPWLSR